MEQISRDDWNVNDSSLLTTNHVLGKGKFGSVTLVGDSTLLRCYAKKTYPINFLSTLQKELNIMLHFDNNPNIIGAKSSVVHFNNKPNDEKVCSIYMEYANKETLKKMISEVSNGNSLPEYTIQRLARMILLGLEALHAEGYVHCDLKPSNILLSHSTTDEEPFDLKLAGFSSSKEPNSDAAFGFMSTVKYMSPEACSRKAVTIPADDIWSLGSIVHEMFGAKPVKDLFEDFYDDWVFYEKITMIAKTFLWRCVCKEADRATATELLNHPFITQKLSPPPSPPLSTIRCTEEDFTTMIPKIPGSIW